MRTTAFLLIASSILCSHAQARLLDDFSQGSLNITAGPFQTVNDVESGLDPSKVIGGERRVTAIDDVSIRINDPTPTPGAMLDQGILKFNGEAQFKYGFGTPLNVDLTQGGAREFRLRISGEMREEYMMRSVLVLETSDGMGGVEFAASGFGGPVFRDNGTIRTGYLRFNTFEDVTDVVRITLAFKGVPAAIVGRDFAVHLFETAIPEPATAILAIAPALCLAASRRSNRRRAS